MTRTRTSAAMPTTRRNPVFEVPPVGEPVPAGVAAGLAPPLGAAAEPDGSGLAAARSVSFV